MFCYLVSLILLAFILLISCLFKIIQVSFRAAPYWFCYLNLDARNLNNEHESFGVIPSSVGHEDTSLAVDDTFLIVQRSTLIVSRFYNELFDKPKTEFLTELSGACDVAELRFVQDIMYSIVKKRTASGHLGPLVERKSGDLKEKLLKDVYSLYLFGEGTIASLPKKCLRPTQNS